jgi:nucleoside-diphosphate-sugar epimerase
MHVLLTGASGHIGSHTFLALLNSSAVKSITAVDVVPLPPHIKLDDARAEFKLVDLTDIHAVDDLFHRMPRCDAVIHLGGIPDPKSLEHRLVHNINVTSTYNVLYTASQRGIKRIVQASSVNAMGLSYTAPEHRWFHAVPFDEDTPCKPEDAYALSK